jgi:hypothetical protein
MTTRRSKKEELKKELLAQIEDTKFKICKEEMALRYFLEQLERLESTGEIAEE